MSFLTRSNKRAGTPEWLSQLKIESRDPIEVDKKVGRKKGNMWNILRVNMVQWRLIRGGRRGPSSSVN